MKLQKLVLPLFGFFCISAISPQPQTDRILFHLPPMYLWEPGNYKNTSDSTVSTWLVRNDQGEKELFVLEKRVAKSSIHTSFYEMSKALLASENENCRISLLDKGNIGNHPFMLFKKVQNTRNSKEKKVSITVLIETENSFHTCTVRSLGVKTPDSFINQWSQILKTPVISLESNKAGCSNVDKKYQEQFILAARIPGSFKNRDIVKRVEENVRKRLKPFQKTISIHDISANGDTIVINLITHMDRDSIANILEINNPTRFIPIYRGDGYLFYKQSADSLISEYAGSSFLSSIPNIDNDATMPYVSYFPVEDEQILMPILKGLLATHGLSGKTMIFTDNQPNSEINYLYLCDMRNIVINESNVASINKTVGQQGEPMLEIQLDHTGKQKLASWTTHNIGAALAIVAGNKIIAASVTASPITNGRIIISGQYTTYAEISDMANALQLFYPVPVKVIK